MLETPDVLIAIDHGLSGTKIIWQLPDSNPQLLMIGAEIISVTDANEGLLDTGLTSGKPEDNIVITLADGRRFAIGKQALSLKGRPPINQSKYEPGIYKTLGTVGAVAKKAGLGRSFTIAISTVLPLSEYSDRKAFAEMLQQELRNFKFGDVTHKVEATISVKPEGAGIAIRQMNRDPDFESLNTLIVMIGHRDASLLPFVEGTPNIEINDLYGDQLGFLEFLTQVVKRASLNVNSRSKAKLPEYLFKTQTPEGDAYLRKIAQMVVKGESEIERKVEALKDAIESSRKWYVEALEPWIIETLVVNLDETDQAVVAGGAALYFKDPLTDFLRQHLRDPDAIAWETPQLLGINEPELAIRVSDVFGIYEDAARKYPDFNLNSLELTQEPIDATEKPTTKVVDKAAARNGRRRSPELPTVSQKGN